MLKGSRRSAVALRPGWCPASRRFRSYDRDELTPEALQRQVESGLGDDALGNPMRVDPDAKTVSTAAGPLPISPLFDPEWIGSRRRSRKTEPSQPMGRFRKKLALNPFARALASPVRLCSLTSRALPRYFLQDIEVVRHPETDKPHLVPGPLSFHRVQPKYWETTDSTANEIDEAKESTSTGGEIATANDPETNNYEGSPGDAERTGRAPITAYIVSDKGFFDLVGGKKPMWQRKLLGTRSGSATLGSFREAEFAPNTGDLLLGMLRRAAVDALIARSNRTQPPLDKFIQPVKSWEEIGLVRRRGCILWLPTRQSQDQEKEGLAKTRYATYDLKDVAYDRKMPVHDLKWLLGDEEVARLRADAPDIFGSGELFVLKTWKSHSMVNLHLLLWRLQGFMPQEQAQ
ncbi:unnamed protein product [Clonostachys rosea f. rosea IK726]|uniref:Esterase-like protein n=2 Tax=Bionectria ochroleuca TaxID=29856 RepID=A0A0B7JX04_BIOOC|nr:unnamed protein product [Clonostachys rosea f. rosea IK726]